MAPEVAERVVNKRRYSAFAGTDLDMVLRTAGIESILSFQYFAKLRAVGMGRRG
ncbi:MULTISPECIES: isochorismatase family protein [Paenarthrobacter]|uniref:isochorismatase family protein n=1 Tax=Paenarthrobacter TaxID=1742992 RepID=UPI0029CA2602|nr:isochorismatase family protein [Paenarthrobacter ureafaciens]